MTDPRSGRCPDDGYCHGSSIDAGSEPCAPGACYRVRHAGPLSGVYPYDRWPDAVKRAHGVVMPRLSAEQLRLAMVALWPDREVVWFAGSDALPEEEREQLSRVALAIADAEDRGRVERGAVVDAIDEALLPVLARAFTDADLLPSSTLRLTERAAEHLARLGLAALRSVVPARKDAPRDS